MSSGQFTFVVVIAVLSAIAGGASIATQAPINASLNRSLNDPLLTAAISFFVGFVALMAAWLVSLAVRETSFTFPELQSIPPWMWIGGILGTVYVVAAIYSVPKIGVLSLAASVVLGQLIAAMFIDATGAFGLEAKPISPTRLLAGAMVLGGLLLSKL
ncbi:MAG: DMT family transporter [Pseudomonadota bacterium]